MKRFLVAAVLGLFLLAPAGATIPGLIPIGSTKQLFIDNHLLEALSNSATFSQARTPRGP